MKVHVQYNQLACAKRIKALVVDKAHTVSMLDVAVLC